MKKFIKFGFLAMILVVALFSINTGVQAQVAATPVCPVGFTCTPVNVNCPPGYICTPVQTDPNCPPGYTCQVTNPTNPIPVTPISTGATVTVQGTPTLTLTYDTSRKESSLKAVFYFSVNAGAKTAYILDWGQVIYTNQTSVGKNFGVIGKVAPASSASTTVDIYGQKLYIIPAGQSVRFVLNSSASPLVMFAGSYAASLTSLYTNTPGMNAGSDVPVPKNQSNSRTIIGEISPYITSVSPTNISVGQTMVMMGQRLGGTMLLIDGVPTTTTLTPLNTTVGNGTGLSFIMPSLPSGYHNLQLNSKTTGLSNVMGFQVGSSITVINPKQGDNLQLGVPTQVNWGASMSGNDTFNIMWSGKGAGGIVASNVSQTQAGCPGIGKGVCGIMWTPTMQTPDAQVTVSRGLSGDTNDFGSSGYFSVSSLAPTSTQPTITILSPNGGTFDPGGQLNLQWTSYAGDFDYYQLMLGNTVANSEVEIDDGYHILKTQNSYNTFALWTFVNQIVTNSGMSADTIKSAYYVKVNAVKSDRVGGGIVYTGKSSIFTISSGSQPPTDKRASIRQLYLTLQCRDPEAQGWDYWTNYQADLGTIQQAMMAGIEYQTKQQIIQIFQQVLGRAPGCTAPTGGNSELHQWYITAWNNGNVNVDLVRQGLGGGTTNPCNGYAYTINLQLGSTGADVVALQTWLISSGFNIANIANGSTAKGYYDSQTANAVMLWQAANGLPVTGSIGPMDRVKLNSCTATVPISAPCPVGYICTPPGGTTMCPAGYTCTNVTSNCPSGYTCYAVNPNTSTTAPVITSFTASPSSISRDGSATLSWTSQNASYCWGAGTGPSARLPVSSSVTVSPSIATKYSLVCVDPNGVSSSPSTVQVSVNAFTNSLFPSTSCPVGYTCVVGNQNPTINSFTVSPSPLVRSRSATLSWTTTGLTSCTIDSAGNTYLQKIFGSLLGVVKGPNDSITVTVPSTLGVLGDKFGTTGTIELGCYTTQLPNITGTYVPKTVTITIPSVASSTSATSQTSSAWDAVQKAVIEYWKAKGL